MKQIINRKKYDTETAYLLAVYRNRSLRAYERELEQWKLENPEEDVENPGPELDQDEEPGEDETEEDSGNSGEDQGSEDEEEKESEAETEDVLSFGTDFKIVFPQDADFDKDFNGPDKPKEPEDEELDPDFSVDEEPYVEEVSDYEWPEGVEEVRVSPLWEIQRLYQKKSTGEYFLTIQSGLMGGKVLIKPFIEWNLYLMDMDYNEELALEWAIDHLDVDHVERIFGEIEE